MEGYMHKWTNYVLGWQRRYFILHNGVLHYCKEKGSPERGRLHLELAQVVKHKSNPLRFYIDTGLTVMHMRAYDRVDSTQWVNAILQMQREIKAKPTEEDPASRLDLFHGKIAELWSIRSQMQAAVDLIPRDLLKSNAEIARIINLSQKMKEVAQITAEALQTEEQGFTSRNSVHQRVLEPQMIYQVEFSPPVRQRVAAEPVQDDRVSISDSMFEDAVSHFSDDSEEEAILDADLHRKCLATLRKPFNRSQFWPTIKHCLKEPLDQFPVSCRQPLSMLQKSAEDLRYTSLLEKAADCHDPGLKIAYVALFALSYLADLSEIRRLPFKSFCGETFEFELDGFKLVAEQVTNKQMCTHVLHEAFEYFSSIEVQSRYRGSNMEFVQKGKCAVKIGEDRFVWEKPASRLCNLMLGDLYTDILGSLEITNLRNDSKALIKFDENGWVQRKTTKIGGIISFEGLDNVYEITGEWDTGLSIMDKDGQTVFAWKPDPRVAGSEYFYNFSEFALQLNIPPACFSGLPKTDSRFRTDIRMLEEGRLDQSSQEFKRLLDGAQEQTSKWFGKQGQEWKYNGDYWKNRLD